ncbi:MAG TPA: DUF899 family protein [Ignavibacteria bacterium]|nr:hypothetical protein [Bacteroidota bacterium]HRI85689.1 DUF899 family protein [Ignavibacteria bacterium]HRJ99926.1 DUF899 family protein [Ignavibacteria bacterium]
MKYSEEEKKKAKENLSEIDKEIELLRKKRIELNSVIASMDVNDYTMKDRNGKDVKLSEMFGDKSHLILIHNMGKGCSYCTMWADGFKDTYKEIEKKASFVLVSPDSPEVHKEFADSRGWNYRTYSAAGTDFIFDMGYEIRKDDKKYYWPGVSVFEKKEDGNIVRVTKDEFGPGDFYCNIWHFIDLLPNENITVDS